MPIYDNDTLGAEALDWVEVEGYEFFPLSRGDADRAESKGHSYPHQRLIEPRAAKDRIIVLTGEVSAILDGARVTLKRGDWVDVPATGLTILNRATTQAEMGWIWGHWGHAERISIALYTPEFPTKYHYHDSDEYWFVFRGNVTLKYHDRHYAVRPGLMLAAGKGYEHGVPEPEQAFEAIIFATQLSGDKRKGLLQRSIDGDPHPDRDVPAEQLTRYQVPSSG